MLKADGAQSARILPGPGAFSFVAAVQGEEHRTCIKCGREAVQSLFKKSGAFGKRGNICRECDKARLRKRYAEHREEIIANASLRYRQNIVENRRRSREKARSPKGLASNRVAVAKYKKNNPHKVRARHLVKSAIQRGELSKPSMCQAFRCTNSVVHAHHADYAKPLDVSWLCPDHHEHVHHLGPVRLKPSASRKYARAPKKSQQAGTIAA